MKEDDSESSSDSDEYQDVPDILGEKKESATNKEESDINSDEESDINSDEESDDQVKASEEDHSDHDEKTATTKAEDVDDVIEEGRLFIRNLPYSCTEEEIKAHVSQFGEVTDVFIPLNAKRESKGYCFVTFMFPEQAIKALEVGMEERDHRRS